MKWVRSILVCLFVFIGICGFTQSGNEEPELAIVLSGGGAKGFAHIPFLQLLDSLEVVPDLIVGNSMGSVVGGLYAMGYPADSLEILAKSVDWDKILTNAISYNYFNPFERDEADKYSLAVPFRDGKLSLPKGLIESQELHLLLTRLSLRVHGINDFDNLPIPFRAMATDIVNGRKVVLGKGDIVTAIRASMALPSIFTPVKYDTLLLIDGGVLDNFPVETARNLGSKVIIGSDVSGGPMPEEKLTSFIEILSQASMISSDYRNREDRENCDLLLDHVVNLTYTSADFGDTEAIIEQGRLTVQEMKEELIELLLPYSGIKSKPTTDREEMIQFDKVYYSDLSSHHQKLLEQRIGMDDKQAFPLEEFEDDMRYGYGSRLFYKLNYRLNQNGDSSFLTLSGEEKPKTLFQGSIHYDTERGAGLIFNITTRDLLGKNSRSLLTVDAAENPKFRAQQRGYFKNGLWWYNLEYFFESIEQNSYVNGTENGNVDFNYQELKLSFNRDFGNNSTLGIGVERNIDAFSPNENFDRLGVARDSLTSFIEKYSASSNGLRVFFMKNDLNKRFFPTKGKDFLLSIDYNFTNDIKVDFFSEQVQNVDTSAGSGLIINSHFLNNYKLGKKWTLQNTWFVGSHIAAREAYYDYSIPRWFFVGGLERRPGAQFVQLPGFRDGEIPATQVIAARFDFQYNPSSNFYIIPSANLLLYGTDDLNSFFSGLGDFNFDRESVGDAFWNYTFSLNLAYQSPIGPIQFLVSKANGIDFARFYLSIGFNFQ